MTLPANLRITRWKITEAQHLSITVFGPLRMSRNFWLVPVASSPGGGETYPRHETQLTLMSLRWRSEFENRPNPHGFGITDDEIAALNALVLAEPWLNLLAGPMFGITEPNPEGTE